MATAFFLRLNQFDQCARGDGASPLGAEANQAAITPDRISFFTVPLRCEAAAEIGCGSRSKPILLQLEREPAIAEPWLNSTGKVLAVVWPANFSNDSRTKAVHAALENSGGDSDGIERRDSRHGIEELYFGRRLVPRRRCGQTQQIPNRLTHRKRDGFEESTVNAATGVGVIREGNDPYEAAIAIAAPWPARSEGQKAASPMSPTRPCDHVSIRIWLTRSK
jgi:hypothetical protein